MQLLNEFTLFNAVMLLNPLTFKYTTYFCQIILLIRKSISLFSIVMTSAAYMQYVNTVIRAIGGTYRGLKKVLGNITEQ